MHEELLVTFDGEFVLESLASLAALVELPEYVCMMMMQSRAEPVQVC